MSARDGLLACVAAMLLSFVVACSAGPEDSAAGAAPASARVQVYTAPGCPYCGALRVYLKARGIAYEEHDVDASLEARQAFRAMGGVGVPLVVIGDRVIHGFNPFSLEAALGADPEPAVPPAGG